MLSWLPPEFRPTVAAARGPDPLALPFISSIQPLHRLCCCTLPLDFFRGNSAQHGQPHFASMLSSSRLLLWHTAGVGGLFTVLMAAFAGGVWYTAE